MQKRFRTGLDQLLKEGVAQKYQLEGNTSSIPLLGAVGPLQFDVLCHRLQSEYGAETRIEPARWKFVRWPTESRSNPKPLVLPSTAIQATDAQNRSVVLFETAWSIDFFLENNSGVTLSENP
jgi:peptide chain release factor 3